MWSGSLITMERPSGPILVLKPIACTERESGVWPLTADTGDGMVLREGVGFASGLLSTLRHFWRSGGRLAVLPS